MRALVIEDDEVLARTVKRVLQTMGFDEVELRYDGAFGLECARQEAPDLIVCDGELPGLNGREVFDMLPDPLHARFVAFTDSPKLFEDAVVRLVTKSEGMEPLRVAVLDVIARQA